MRVRTENRRGRGLAVRRGASLPWLLAAVLAAAAPAGGCGSGGTGDAGEDAPPGEIADGFPDDAQDAAPEDGGRDADADRSPDALDDGPAAEAADADAGGGGDDGAEAAEDADAEAETSIGERCFGDIWDPSARGPEYDRFSPIMGSHCYGTNHQDIRDVERVVFLGDSVTAGTPPSLSTQYYRSILADRLAERFRLVPPGPLWKMVNILDGTSISKFSGDFANCSKWGARTDDLMRDNSQVLECMPDGERYMRTLVIMTVGGNDIAAMRQAISDGEPLDAVRARTEEFVQLLRDTAHWLKDDPTRFPTGVDVIFANLYEFTDATGDISSCTAADIGGFGAPIEDPERAAALEDLVIWANEQYMSVAVETGTDVILMLEHFCGHGFHHDDPTGRCYRGPGAELWFDLTCIHPNPTGHERVADMFMAVVDE